MRQFAFGAAIICAIALSTAVSADEAQSTNQSAATTENNKTTIPAATTTEINKQVVCASTYHDGSVVKHPTCLTQDQRKFNQLQEQQSVRDLQTRSLQTSNTW